MKAALVPLRKNVLHVVLGFAPVELPNSSLTLRARWRPLVYARPVNPCVFSILVFVKLLYSFALGDKAVFKLERFLLLL